MERTARQPFFERISGVLRRFLHIVKRPYSVVSRNLYRWMPKGLFGRSLLIFLLPMIILQAVVAYVFMERHWELVTQRLSEAVARDIAAIADLMESMPLEANREKIMNIAQEDMQLNVTLLALKPLPKPRPKPFFSPLDRHLSQSIRDQVQRPFWIDTVGNSRNVEIRIQLKENVMRVFARRSHTYASNSHIFIVWMISTSLVLITVSVLFLRNQIRPIQRLAAAAEAFGMGRSVNDFRPAGASEVRRASYAFLEMRQRIERQIEQRTAMLAGVSHDLRTVLTRFQLQLALINPDGPEAAALNKDISEMNRMLEAYLAFAKGDEDEASDEVDIPLLLEDLEAEAEIAGGTASSTFKGAPVAVVKPVAFKRCLANLVVNACRYGSVIELNGIHTDGWLTVTVHDNGPGIPEDERDNVFRPFYRLDTARNQDESSTGLGLAIARDIARGHGGDIVLGESPLGGLKARVRIPA